MRTIREQLEAMTPGLGTRGKSGPAAIYFPDMDSLEFLLEDCSYVEDRVDEWLTILWHPARVADAVGVKFKGFRFIFERIKDCLSLKDDDFLPLVAILEPFLSRVLAAALEPQDSVRWLKYGVVRAVCNAGRVSGAVLREVEAAA